MLFKSSVLKAETIGNAPTSVALGLFFFIFRCVCSATKPLRAGSCGVPRHRGKHRIRLRFRPKLLPSPRKQFTRMLIASPPPARRTSPSRQIFNIFRCLGRQMPKAPHRMTMTGPLFICACGQATQANRSLTLCGLHRRYGEGAAMVCPRAAAACQGQRGSYMMARPMATMSA